MKKARYNFQYQDMYVQHYILSNTEIQNTTGLTTPLDKIYQLKNNNMLSEKAPVEELDEHN